MSFCQKAKPDWSGKRERKSMYCCWTKKSASSIVIGLFVPGRRRTGVTFVLTYIKSEGRRLPASETMRSVGACWLCANADDAATTRTKTATINLRILLLQNVTEPAGESATERPTRQGVGLTLAGSGAAAVTTRRQFRHRPGRLSTSINSKG